MTCAHLKLLGPCFKTGQMGDRPDTECGTEQRTADSKTMGAQCMHRTRIILLSTANHEFTNPPFNSQAHPPSDRPGFKPKLVLFSVFQRRARPIRRTLCASAPLANTKTHADDFAEHRTHIACRPVAEYAPDTSAPSASTITVSRSLALSFQSAFQLSFTVLVCYRSRSHI